MTHYGTLSRENTSGMVICLFEQWHSSFNFNLFQDRETIAAFLTEYCRVPVDVVSGLKSPKNLVFELMETIKMMDPGAAELSASSS